MGRKIILLSLLPLAMGCSAPPIEQSVRSTPARSTSHKDSVTAIHASAWHIVQRNPSVLVFNDRDTLFTGLRDLEQLAQFTTPLGRSWFMFSGIKVADEKHGVALYVFSPGDSTSSHALEQPWHMPGRLIDGDGSQCYYEAEVFAGEVLRDTIGVIWYERSLMPDGHWRLNTTLLDLNGVQPDTLVLFGHRRKSTTIDLAFHGKCQLINSLDQRLKR